MDCECCSQSVFIANAFEPNVCRNCRHEERTHQRTGLASDSLANSSDVLVAIQGNTEVENQRTPQPKPRQRPRPPQSVPESDSVVQFNNRTLTLRSQLENAFKTTRASPGEGAQLAKEIMCVDGDVRSRYFCLDLREIIDKNKPHGDSLSNDYLTMLSSAFDILEKYAVNLLKLNRPQYWRQIKYSNGVFQARVDCMKGSRDILKQMGYSEEHPNSLSFPETSVEPDFEKVSRVATDLLLARIEVDALYEGSHPHPEALKNFVPLSLPSHLSQQPAPVSQKPFQSHMDMPQQAGVQHKPEQSNYSPQSQTESQSQGVKEAASVSAYRPIPKPRNRLPSASNPNQLTNQPSQGQTQPALPQSKPVQLLKDIARPPGNYQTVGDAVTQQPQRQTEKIWYPPCNDESPPSLDIYMSISNPAPQTQEVVAPNRPSQPVALQADSLITKSCPSCHYDCSGNDKFCSECGWELPQTPAKIYGMLPKLCPKCGEEIQLEKRFCPRCGTKTDLQASPTLQSQPTLPQNEKRKQQGQQWKSPTETRVLEVYSKPMDKQQPSSATVARPAPLEVKPESATSSGQWSCEYCTFLNDASCRICKMCSKTRASVPAEVKPAPGSPQQIVQSEVKPQPLVHPQQQQQHVSGIKTVQVEKEKSPREHHQAHGRQEMRLNLTDERAPTVAAAAGRSDAPGPRFRVDERQEDKLQQLKDKGQLKEQHLKELHLKETEDKAAIQGSDPNKLNKMDQVNIVQTEAGSKYDKDLARERASLSRQHREPASPYTRSGPYGSGSQIDEVPPVMDDTIQQKSNYQCPPSRSEDPRSGYAATPADRSYPSSSGEHGRRMFPDDIERRQREMEEDRQRRQQIEEERRKEEERLRQLEAARQAEEAIRQRDRQFFSFLKEGETNGFNPEEVEVALKVSGDDPPGPIRWLVNQLPSVLDMVAELATTHGQKQYPDLRGLGTFGAGETRKYYMECGGDCDSTVKALCEARQKQIDELKQLGNFKHADVCMHLMQTNGDVGKAVVHLQNALLQPFVDRIWQEEQFSSDDESEVDGLKRKLIPTSVKELAQIKDVDPDRRTQVLFAEYGMKSWGRASLALRLLDEREDECSYGVSDVVDAVEAYQEYERANDFLNQECLICTFKYPRNKMISLPMCQCSLCRSCLKNHFSIVIKEKTVKHLVCPLCSEPSMDDQQAADLHFQMLSAILHHVVDKDLYEMMQQKLNERNLMDDPDFRWCPHCLNGFVNENRLQRKMTCPNCNKDSCFECKEKWEPQHDDVTCEQFRQWKVDNDPDNQQRGLAAQLDQDGINCPRCKFRYALSKGGCIHFKCTQCPHEFCSGCSQPFLKTCSRFDDCRTRGLHAHHPRDCLFFLRDNAVPTLQHLLDMHKVKYDREIPQAAGAQDEGNEAAAKPELKCTVTEQKEMPDGLHDEPCGRICEEGFAGLCKLHYKEYLVHLINVNNIDPIDIMDVDSVWPVLLREKKQMPPKQAGESPANYLMRLRQHVKDEIHLEQRDKRGVLQWNG